MKLHHAFSYERLASAGGAATAVVDGDVTVSYDELDAAANRVANGLLAAAAPGRDRVAYLGRNTLASVELMVGAARAGLVLALLNWRLSPPELHRMLDDCQGAVLVVSAEFTHLLDGFAGASQLRIIVAGGDDDQWRPWLAGQHDARPRAGRRADDVAIQLYTSGTTGQPKGVMLTHAGLADSFTDTSELWQLSGDSVMLVVLPLFHIIGVASVLLALSAGSTLVVGNDASLPVIRRLVGAHRVTNITLVSSILEALATQTRDGLETLETISYGGAPMSEPLLRMLLTVIDCRLVQIYGLTETTGALTALLPSDHDFAPGDERAAARLRSCGQPRPGVELRIADPQTGAGAGSGQPGEIQARTVRLMSGYWAQPDATREAFTADGWFRTGDIGDFDEDGYLFLRDRLKDMIVSGGENVFPAEVEMALSAHPGVAEVAVIGIPHERWGETPHALVVLRPGAATDEAGLIAFTRGRLAHYKCPTSVQFVPQLPLSATGKVLRRVLREPYWEGRARRI
jgi:acyl-CoA synthetase (AMP-forming)/AMP-acid ligase II